jgi:5-methylcytosine-specific restriction endonuclease McrA
MGNVNMPYKDPLKKKNKQREYSKKHYKKNLEKIKATTRKRSQELKEDWKQFKSTLSCLECGIYHPAILDFHHIDPEMKTASVHSLVQSGRYKKAMEEVEQCVVLCSNCHRVYHYNEHKKEKEKGAEAP